MEAQFILGLQYSLGIGVQKNDIHAYKWFRIASFSGHEKAKSLLDSLVKEMSNSQIEAGHALVLEWLAYNGNKSSIQAD